MYRRYGQILEPLYFPSQLGKPNPHRRHLSDLSFQGWGQRWLKWTTSLVWWFIMAFPWHQVLSYTESVLLTFYTLWLMLENSATREAIKWFPERKGGYWGLQVSMQDAQETIWDVSAQNSTSTAQICDLWFLFFPTRCIHDVTCFIYWTWFIHMALLLTSFYFFLNLINPC